MDELLVQQGLNIMLYGMGMVFCFLTLLVFCISATSALILKWFPETTAPSRRKSRKTSTATTVSPVTLAIIQAAIDQHRHSKP